MNRSCVSPFISPAGTLKMVLAWPGARPSRTRCALLNAYTFISVKPWLSTRRAVGAV